MISNEIVESFRIFYPLIIDIFSSFYLQLQLITYFTQYKSFTKPMKFGFIPFKMRIIDIFIHYLQSL